MTHEHPSAEGAQPEGLAVHAGIARMMKRRGSERADTLDVAASVAIEQLIARVQELGRELESIGAGGVEPLRRRADAGLARLTECGAAAWAGVDAQALRDGEDIRARGVQGESNAPAG